jgi:hypothetical protein
MTISQQVDLTELEALEIIFENTEALLLNGQRITSFTLGKRRTLHDFRDYTYFISEFDLQLPFNTNIVLENHTFEEIAGLSRLETIQDIVSFELHFKTHIETYYVDWNPLSQDDDFNLDQLFNESAISLSVTAKETTGYTLKQILPASQTRDKFYQMVDEIVLALPDFSEDAVEYTLSTTIDRFLALEPKEIAISGHVTFLQTEDALTHHLYWQPQVQYVNGLTTDDLSEIEPAVLLNLPIHASNPLFWEQLAWFFWNSSDQ